MKKGEGKGKGGERGGKREGGREELRMGNGGRLKVGKGEG